MPASLHTDSFNRDSNFQMSNHRHSTKLLFSLLVTFTSISMWSQLSSNLAASALSQTSAPSTTPARVTQTQVKIFFPKSNQQDFTKVESVLRTTSSPSLARFAIEQVIAGPTSQEKAKGLMGPIRLTGTSNCGKDFTISINNGVARLQFCKTFIYGGVGDVARTKSSINATLLQFPTIKSVIILDKNGKCWGDESGENRCLRTQ